MDVKFIMVHEVLAGPFLLNKICLNQIKGWMDERCFRPLLCTVKAELGRGQPGLMRWIWDETLPQSSIDRSTFYSAAHRATKWARGRPPKEKERNQTNTMHAEMCTLLIPLHNKHQWPYKCHILHLYVTMPILFQKGKHTTELSDQGVYSKYMCISMHPFGWNNIFLDELDRCTMSVQYHHRLLFKCACTIL